MQNESMHNPEHHPTKRGVIQWLRHHNHRIRLKTLKKFYSSAFANRGRAF